MSPDQVHALALKTFELQRDLERITPQPESVRLLERAIAWALDQARVEWEVEGRAEMRRSWEASLPTVGDFVCSECCLGAHSICLDRARCDCVRCLKADRTELQRRLRQTLAIQGRDRQ